MARKRISQPVQFNPEPMDKHEGMVSDMHSALYGLSNQIRPPFPGVKSNLLPTSIQPSNPKAAAARAHIAKLHKAFKEHAKEKK